MFQEGDDFVLFCSNQRKKPVNFQHPLSIPKAGGALPAALVGMVEALVRLYEETFDCGCI